MAYNFTGAIDDYLSAPDGGPTDITGSLTVHVWAKHVSGTIATSQTIGLAGKYYTSGTARQFVLILRDADTAGFGVSTDGTYQAGNWVTASHTIGTTWHQYAGVFEASTRIELYANGASLATDTTSVPASLHNGTAPFHIGTQFDPTNSVNFFTGDIADVAVWSAALSDEEIAMLGAGFSPLFVRPGSLAFYAPLTSSISDVSSGVTITNHDSDADLVPSAHPPIIYPDYPIIGEHTNRRKIGEPASSGPSCVYLGNEGSATNATTYTFSATTLPNEHLIIAAGSVRVGGLTHTLTAGGVSGTELITEISDFGAHRLSLFHVDNTAGSGNDVVLTCSAQSLRAAIGIWQVKGANMTPYATASEARNVDNTHQDNLIDVPRHGLVISAIHQNSNGSPTTQSISDGMSVEFNLQPEGTYSLSGAIGWPPAETQKQITATPASVISTTDGYACVMLSASFSPDNDFSGFANPHTGPASSPPSYNYLGGSESTTNATSYTFSSFDLGQAEDAKTIIVGIHLTNTTDTGINSVTVGGNAATEVAFVRGNYLNAYWSALYRVDLTTETSGDIVITTTSTNSRCAIAVYKATGINSTPYDTDTVDNRTTTTTIANTLNIPRRGLVFNFGMRHRGPANTVVCDPANITLDYDPGELEGGASVYVHSFSGYVSSETQKTFTVTCSDVITDTKASAVMASFTAADPS